MRKKEGYDTNYEPIVENLLLDLDFFLRFYLFIYLVCEPG